MKAKDDSVAISELGDMTVCPRRLHLRLKHGARTSRQREEKIERGNAVHKEAYQQVSPDARTKDTRCFIASCVYGSDAQETNALREFRDRRLMTTRGGRMAVDWYYRMSPGAARACERHPFLKRCARRVLNMIVKRVGGRA